jgi:hypothetical protein
MKVAVARNIQKNELILQLYIYRQFWIPIKIKNTSIKILNIF